MTEKRFWEIVELVNWPNICNEYRPYYKARKNLIKVLTKEESKEFSNFSIGFKKVLYTMLFNKVKCMGDDSYGDFIAHIIGMGQVEYEKCVNDNNYALNAYQNTYIENFFYCIPSDEDYTLKETNYEEYIKRAKKIALSLDRAIKNPIICNALYGEGIATNLSSLWGFFNDLALTKDFKKFITNKDLVNSNFEAIRKVIDEKCLSLPHILFMSEQEINDKMGHGTDNTLSYGNSVFTNEWIIKNLINDIVEKVEID